MRIKLWGTAALCLLFFTEGHAQGSDFLALLKNKPKWVDSVYNTMSRRERVAQLFFVRAHTNLGSEYEGKVGKLIAAEQVGGVVFFQGGPGRQAILTNKYQALAKVPLLTATDGEWGLGMRLDSTVSYPYQMALGAIQDNKLLYTMGQQVARDFKRVGLNINFAPVADINNNPKNPVINYRSFGENKYNVTEKAMAYMKGMQSGGLLISLKHFPGHGDTDVDSHYGLPQLNFTRERLDTMEMYPFKKLIEAGANGIMIAHMNIPALDGTKDMPSSLSRKVITDLLKKQLRFNGMVYSDAMEMKGVTSVFKNGTGDVMAARAGMDVLELSEDTHRGIDMIVQAIRSGEISEAEIEERVKKILTAKYYAGLTGRRAINPTNIAADLNRPESASLINEMARGSVTLLKGKTGLQALQSAANTAIICIGDIHYTTFQSEVRKHFWQSTFFNLPANASAMEVGNLVNGLKTYEQIIVAIIDQRTRPGSNMPLSDANKNLVNALSANKKTCVALFGNPYNLSLFNNIEQCPMLLVAYQKDNFMQRAAAEIVTGMREAKGKLPVSIGAFKYGQGE